MRKSKTSDDVIQQHMRFQQVFGSEAGKAVLYDLMKFGHMLHSSFSPKDPYETAFREGERNIVLRIMSVLEMDPEQLKQRIKEGQENE